MVKINPVSFTLSSAGRPIVLDDKGRFWVLTQNNQWSHEYDLPDDPTPAIEVVNTDIDM